MADLTPWKTLIDQTFRRYAKRISKSDREDTLQDLYVAVMEAKLPDDPIAARKKVEEICREKLRVQKTDDVSLSDPSLRETLPALTRPGIKLDAVRDAVNQLPDRERCIIKGIFYENQSEADLAQMLGQSRAWVKRTKELAMKKIESLLTKEM
jgi:DNA-directed RNA polymerase specialized sigma24 family protein